MSSPETELSRLGWREWTALPDLNIPLIKAKVDTGARSSALHAFMVDPYKRGGSHWIMFAIHPYQNRTDIIVECHAPVHDKRVVSDSGGHRNRRYVIKTLLVVGQKIMEAELTLTNRDTMKFRMLLGRTAMRGHYVVDPQKSYIQGKPDIVTPLKKPE